MKSCPWSKECRVNTLILVPILCSWYLSFKLQPLLPLGKSVLRAIESRILLHTASLEPLLLLLFYSVLQHNILQLTEIKSDLLVCISPLFDSAAMSDSYFHILRLQVTYTSEESIASIFSVVIQQNEATRARTCYLHWRWRRPVYFSKFLLE
jgi:hypothetical protein